MLMIKPEVIEFCEDHKISIRKFLQENYRVIKGFPFMIGEEKSK